jgi:hypothetical protein
MRARVSILRSAKAAFLAAIVSGCATSREPSTPFCEAVLRAANTQMRGTLSAVSYYTIDEVDGEPVILGVACAHENDARMGEFCRSIMGNTSREFTNAFAYAVAGCVEQHGRVQSLIIGQESSGLRRHPHNLESMDGRVHATSLRLREIDGGFELVFDRRRP